MGMFAVNERFPGSPGEEPTILVAEDDRDDGLLLRRAFWKEGVRAFIRFVADGEEAIRYLKGSGPYADRSKYPLPAMLVLDLGMPRMGGLEVLNWMQSHSVDCDIPVIVLSGSAAPEDVDKVLRAGAKACITKPQDPAELLQVVRSLKAQLSETTDRGLRERLAGVGGRSAKELGPAR